MIPRAMKYINSELDEPVLGELYRLKKIQGKKRRGTGVAAKELCAKMADASLMWDEKAKGSTDLLGDKEMQSTPPLPPGVLLLPVDGLVAYQWDFRPKYSVHAREHILF